MPGRARCSRRWRGSRRAMSGRRRRSDRAGGIATGGGGPRATIRGRAGRLEGRGDPGGVDRCEREGPRRLAGDRHHRGRSAIAQSQARTTQPCDLPVPCRFPGRTDAPGQVAADRLRAGQPARDVVTDVGHDRRPRVRREERIERRDAVGLRRGDGESLADVVECRGADPADPRLDGVERRDQQGAAGPRCVAAARRVPVDAAVPRAADPTRLRRAEDGVHGSTLSGGRERPDDVQIHPVESSHYGTPGSRPIPALAPALLAHAPQVRSLRCSDPPWSRPRSGALRDRTVVSPRRMPPDARRSGSIVRPRGRPACPRRRSVPRRDRRRDRGR